MALSTPRGETMRRRDFVTLLAGAAAPWPIGAQAQQPERTRRIAVLMNTGPNDQEGQAGIVAFREGLQQLGWTDGNNVRLDIRWGENNGDLDRKYATELVALASEAGS
jgi:putative ABC transport system substrate-binding protein